MFHIIPEAYAVTKLNGIYRQVQVYQHAGRVFVKHGSGFVYLFRDGGTSVPKLHVDEIHGVDKLYNELGYMCMPGFEKRKRD